MKELSFNPLKSRKRATFAAGTTNEPRLGTIDSEKEVLHDVQITLEGEAKGHGIWLDRQFCEDVAKQGNEMGAAGVKVRFGHPAMCSDAIGTYLGRAKNFRVADVTRKESGEKAAGVIADIELAAEAHSAPSGDLAKWVLETATNSPDTFGQSIVFTYGDYKVKDKDGNDHSYKAEVAEPYEAWEAENEDASIRECTKKRAEFYDAWASQSADGKTYVVLGKLHGTDFTDDPAATDGVFSSTDLASEAEQMLDEHPQIQETLEKHPDSVFQFLTRIGLLDKLESKRVSGIQAEKDKELDALRKEFAEKEAQFKAAADAEKADVERLTAELAASQADVELNKKNFSEKDEALAKALAEVEQLKSRIADGEKALAASREQFDRLQKKHAEIIGGALNAVHETAELHCKDLIRSKFSK